MLCCGDDVFTLICDSWSTYFQVDQELLFHWTLSSTYLLFPCFTCRLLFWNNVLLATLHLRPDLGRECLIVFLLTDFPTWLGDFRSLLRFTTSLTRGPEAHYPACFRCFPASHPNEWVINILLKCLMSCWGSNTIILIRCVGAVTLLQQEWFRIPEDQG